MAHLLDGHGALDAQFGGEQAISLEELVRQQREEQVSVMIR